MKFYRIKDDLALLERKNTVSAADILNCIYDLCQDVRTETGTGVEQKEAGDTEALGRRLPAVGRTIARICQRNQGVFRSPTLRERAEEISRELEQLAAVLDQAQQEERQLVRQKNDLEAQRAAIARSEQTKLQLRQDCARLEQEISGYSDGELTELQQTWAHLCREQSSLQEQGGELRDKANQLQLELAAIETQNEELKDQCLTFQQQTQQALIAKTLLQKRLEEEQIKNAEHQARLLELERELEEAQAQTASCAEVQIPQASNALEAARKEISQARQQLSDLEQALEGEQLQLQALAAEEEKMAGACCQAEEEKGRQLAALAQKRQTLDALRETIRKLDQECRSLQAKAEELDQELAQRDFDQIKQRLNAAICEKEGLIERYSDLETQLRAEQSQAESQRKKTEQLALQRRQMIDRSRQEQEAARQVTEKLDVELVQLAQKREELLRQQQALVSIKGDLERWFKESEAEQCQTRIKQLTAQVRMMREARDALLEEYRLFAIANGMPAEEQEKKLSFQTDIDAMQSQLFRFQEAYKKVLQSFGSEG